MAKKAKSLYTKVAHVPIFHKTSIGRNPSKAKMNKSRRRSFKKYRGQGRWQNKINDYPIVMKEKIITLKVNGAAQGQWSSLLLELNLMKQAWKSYGVDIKMSASGLKNVLNHGTKVNDGSNTTKRRSV